MTKTKTNISTFYIKQNDTRPSFGDTLLDADGSAVNLSNASAVNFHMATSTGSVIVSTAASIVTAADGTVKYLWASADTDTAQTAFAEWEVDWGSSSLETYPNHRDIPVVISSEVA